MYTHTHTHTYTHIPTTYKEKRTKLGSDYHQHYVLRNNGEKKKETMEQELQSSEERLS